MSLTLPVDWIGHARRSLRDERNLLDVLLDSVEVAVVACGPNGRITHANRRSRELMDGACATGLDPEAWLERVRPCIDAGRPLSLQDLPLIRALQGETVRDFDVRIRRAGGDTLLAVSANPVEDEKGRRLGAVLMFVDVSEQRAQEARVREALRDVGSAVEIDEAIDAGHLLLYSQPIVEIASGEIALEELLLRMRSPDGTIAGPSGFLAAAEHYGTVTRLDRWVFEQAAQIAAKGHGVSVNVSAHTAGKSSFLEVVEHTLESNGVEPSLITFEITETAVVSDIVQASRFADRLNAIGCHFALDDFGTGYAAFMYLKHLPIQYLKIDMDFVRDLVENSRSRAVVAGIVGVAAGFGQRTIAEGVEDGSTLLLLGELGVDLAQGFHIARPAPITAGADA
jgi:EAL domain-containing protein (putative c-di-GMP-specific phosphodiesterase class I)